MNSTYSPPDLIGESQSFLEALALTSATAPLDRPVLLLGERGTGKELLAGRLHFLSSRWENPFIKVNCAALSEDLLESELFGHESGAFTGATKRHTGRFERAEGGTLFLDEIASASLRIQEKLLRVIEYGEYERLGGEITRATDVRIIAAANVNLKAKANAGSFRADLLDRLAFEVITAPPLRTRGDDIMLLAAHFCRHFAAELNRDLQIDVDGEKMDIQFNGFTQRAKHTLQNYNWPGNVRELKNVVERSLYRLITKEQKDQLHSQLDHIILDPFEFIPLGAQPDAVSTNSDLNDGLKRDDVKPRDTAINPLADIPAGKPYDLRERLNTHEYQWVKNALTENDWQQKRTAQFLGLSYHQMRGLMRKHQFSREADRD